MKFGFAVVLLFLSTLLFCISLKWSRVVKEKFTRNSIWANNSGVSPLTLTSFGDDDVADSSLESSEQDALGDTLGALKI